MGLSQDKHLEVLEKHEEERKNQRFNLIVTAIILAIPTWFIVSGTTDSINENPLDLIIPKVAGILIACFIVSLIAGRWTDNKAAVFAVTWVIGCAVLLIAPN